MKNQTADIILLCKGWYDKEKYPTIVDALKQYYHIHYSEDYEDIDERFLLHCLIKPTVQDIANKYPSILDSFLKVSLFGEGVFLPDDSNRDIDYNLFYRIVQNLTHTMILGKIDLSDYFGFTDDPDYPGHQKRYLIEDII